MRRMLESARRKSLLLVTLITIALGSASCSFLLPARAIRANYQHPPGDLDLLSLHRLPGHPWIQVVTTAGDTLQAPFGGVIERSSADRDSSSRPAGWLRLRAGKHLRSTFPRYADRNPHYLRLPMDEVAAIRQLGPVAGVGGAFLSGLALDVVIGVVFAAIAIAASGPVISFGY